jgi:hypothetical protein
MRLPGKRQPTPKMSLWDGSSFRSLLLKQPSKSTRASSQCRTFAIQSHSISSGGTKGWKNMTKRCCALACSEACRQ